MLPRGGEKRKKKKTVVKVIVDNDEIIEVLGLSGPWTIPGAVGLADRSSGRDDWADMLGHRCHPLGGQREQAAEGQPQDIPRGVPFLHNTLGQGQGVRGQQGGGRPGGGRTGGPASAKQHFWATDTTDHMTCVVQTHQLCTTL